MAVNHLMLEEIVRRALQEDLGWGDVSTESVVAESAAAVGVITCKARGVIAGLPVAEKVFDLLEPPARLSREVEEGAEVAEGQTVATVEGPTRAILGGERVALNFLQRMSGIATQTAEVVRAVRPFGVRVVDTRKTTPGLRLLEKYAVRVGGGFNHRLGLDDGVLLKENHIVAAGGIDRAVAGARARVGHMMVVEVEVTNMDEVRQALEAGADAILLDNMDLDEMREAVRVIDGRVTVEASGGITAATASDVARTGVDIMSVGFLTHSYASLDISLNLQLT
ncbi:MAG: carboxylating nicotinate-nucleotide diphosphorylase [Bacillota bacterium]